METPGLSRGALFDGSGMKGSGKHVSGDHVDGSGWRRNTIAARRRARQKRGLRPGALGDYVFHHNGHEAKDVEKRDYSESSVGMAAMSSAFAAASWISRILRTRASVEKGLLRRMESLPMLAFSRTAASVYPDMKMTEKPERLRRSFSTSSGPPMRGMTISVTTTLICPGCSSTATRASSPLPACTT